jgi:predicted dehydrogenase
MTMQPPSKRSSSVSDRTVRMAIIGGGLMGREVASAAARWMHVTDVPAELRITHVCDLNEDVLTWYKQLSPPPTLSTDYRDVLRDDTVDAVYCAVPHHLHERVYTDVLRSGKHLLAEKPFGIDLAACKRLLSEVSQHSSQLVRVSSELPFYPGGQHVWRWIAERRYGRVLEVRASFLHSSDLDPFKPISWKRQARFNGVYGCMGDLGLHALHIPLRAGWEPVSVRAVLSNVVAERPGPDGALVPCDTWDNALLLCVALDDGNPFPLVVDTKRMAPGETNTWSIEVYGTRGSVAYTTKLPKTIRWMDYEPGADQTWCHLDLGSRSAYPTITGPIFEVGFSDCVQQMLVAFIDELVNGRSGMLQPFYCATPEEALASHRVFTAALDSAEEDSATPTVEG